MPMVPPVAYSGLYVALRALGKLSVNRQGWQAGCIHLGRRVVVTALRLFTLFELPLRLESVIRRRLARTDEEQDAPSEVEVEVVSIA